MLVYSFGRRDLTGGRGQQHKKWNGKRGRHGKWDGSGKREKNIKQGWNKY